MVVMTIALLRGGLVEAVAKLGKYSAGYAVLQSRRL